METPKDHFNRIAHQYDLYKQKNSFYYTELKSLLRSLVPINKKVLEIGCGSGDILYSLNPKMGLGVDISPEMVKLAQAKYSNHPNLTYKVGSGGTLKSKIKWDYVIMSDVIEHLEDPAQVFSNIFKILGPKTVFIITMANPVWEPILMVAEKLKLKMPEGPHFRMQFNDIQKLLNKTGWKVQRHDHYLLFPLKIPLITTIINKLLTLKFNKYAFIEFIVASKENNQTTHIS